MLGEMRDQIPDETSLCKGEGGEEVIQWGDQLQQIPEVTAIGEFEEMSLHKGEGGEEVIWWGDYES